MCDLTELDLGIDPGLPDSDRDGLPDFTELISGFDPADPLQPGPDQVAYLAGAPHAELRFELRLTIDGSGQGYTGEFGPASASEPSGMTAGDFFDGAAAVGAVPPDNVRGMQASLEHFATVNGRTRLSFELFFRYGVREAMPCTGAFPYTYRLNAESGRPGSARNYLLIVSANPNEDGRPSFCPPADCL